MNSQIVVMIWHTYLYWACEKEFNCLRFLILNSKTLITEPSWIFRSTESPDIQAEEFDYPISNKKNKICMWISGCFMFAFILTLIALSLIF